MNIAIILDIRVAECCYILDTVVVDVVIFLIQWLLGLPSVISVVVAQDREVRQETSFDLHHHWPDLGLSNHSSYHLQHSC